jgi:phytoene desaturase
MSTYTDPRVLGSIFRRGRLYVNRTMDETNRMFFDDPRLVQLFDRYATYNGSDPYRVPGTLNIIPHVEYNMGSYAVEGGIHAIPKALRRLAENLGVEFFFNTRVTEIRRGGGDEEGRAGAVTGISYEDGFEDADVVVSGVDARRTYEELLADPDAPYARRYRELEPSSSGLVFFWGMKSSYPELSVNNIFFSGDYPAEFRAIFEELRCPEDPTVYVNITSKVSPEDVPEEGGENWFVLINAPRNAGQDWESETRRVRKTVLDRLKAALGRAVEEDIAVEDTLDPQKIEERSGSMFGSLYGISSNSKTAAFLRHPAWTSRYPNLFFVGGSVHPGGGMPLAILSGKIAAQSVIKHFSLH